MSAQVLGVFLSLLFDSALRSLGNDRSPLQGSGPSAAVGWLDSLLLAKITYFFLIHLAQGTRMSVPLLYIAEWLNGGGAPLH